MSKKGKVVLTGSNGFIGSHLAEYLAKQGYEVHCIIRPTSNLKWIKDKGYVFHDCGLNNVEQLVKAFEGASIIYHLAGVVASLSYEGYYIGNVTLTQHVLDAALAMSKPPDRIVVTSSLAVCGPSKKEAPIDESVGFNPVSLYGKAKVEQEKLCAKYFDKLPITIARPSVITGEREAELFEFVKAVNGGVVPLVGSNDKYLVVIDIIDLVKALYDMSVAKSTINEAYLLASEEIISWKELADICAKHLDKKPVILRLPHWVIRFAGSLSGTFGKVIGKPQTFDSEKAKEGVQEAWICSVAKAKKDFGFKQTISISDGVKRSIAWYKKEGWL